MDDSNERSLDDRSARDLVLTVGGDIMTLGERKEKLLRTMVEAKRRHTQASADQKIAWEEYIKAQAAFTGAFSGSEYPLGPFIVGDTLVQNHRQADWPAPNEVFSYTKVIRCPTSE